VLLLPNTSNLDYAIRACGLLTEQTYHCWRGRSIIVHIISAINSLRPPQLCFVTPGELYAET
jgi:hypothetical protein